MARLTALERDSVPAEAKTFYDRDVERYGAVLNNTKIYAHNVTVLAAIKELAARFAQMSSVPMDLRALLRVRVATLNGCPF